MLSTPYTCLHYGALMLQEGVCNVALLWIQRMTEGHAGNTCIRLNSPTSGISTSLKVFKAVCRWIDKPRLHDTTCCQTGCQSGLTNRLYRVYKHSTGCQMSNPFDNLFDKRLYRLYSRLSNRLSNRVVQPVWQPCWTNSLFVQHGC